MPLYIYECVACEIEIEELRSMSDDDAIIECPICHAVCVRTVSSFVFKQREEQRKSILYGEVPSNYHGLLCGCCGPRRRL
ncbi:MAG: zinc ribbon domain-containing protein [Chloroflexi bacterium]|nr:zinc ribbon domain-containing protein [Chloroflexota bacterium]